MKKGKIIGNTLIVIGMLLMIVAVLTDIATPLLGIAGLIVTCGGLIYFLFFWRCPSCRMPLPFHGMIGMEYCPYCGETLGKL